MRLPEPVRLLVEECVVASQAVVVDLVIRGHYRKPVLEVYLDGPGPVTTELCAEVSKRISAALDGKDLISADYRLEVSSPGLDRPLRYLWQYQKHLGRPFRFKLASPPEGSEPLTGTLSAVEEDVLIVKTAEATETRVRFADVREARIVLPW